MVDFVSPRANKIHSYTQMVDTPKMSNGHQDEDQDNPNNSTTHFDRVRKESAGHTPFFNFDTTTSVKTQSSNNATVVSSTAVLRTNDSDEENKIGGEKVALSISTRSPGQALETNKVNNPTSSGCSIGRSAPPINRNNSKGLGYNVVANPSDYSSSARCQPGRLHNPRAQLLLEAPTPQKVVLKILSTEDKEKSEYYQARFAVIRELEEIVVAQSQVIAQLLEDRDELFSRVEDLEDREAAASKPSRRRKMRFLPNKSAAASSHRMTLRRRKNQN